MDKWISETIRSRAAAIHFWVCEAERGKKALSCHPTVRTVNTINRDEPFSLNMADDLRCTATSSHGPPSPSRLAAKKKREIAPQPRRKESHQYWGNERPRLQAPFDTNKCANVAAPDGANECIAVSPPNFTSTVRCSRNEQLTRAPTMRASSLTMTVGREGREGRNSFRSRGHWPDDTLYPSLSPRCWENAIFSILCMMTPIYRLHLPSLLTQTGPKRKPRSQVPILSISSIPFSQNGGGGRRRRRRRWNGLSVYSRLFHLDGLPQRSRLGSNYSEHISAWLWRSGMLSPLCWQIHTEMGREREKVWRPIYCGAAIVKERFLGS